MRPVASTGCSLTPTDVLRFGAPNEALGLMDDALDLAAVHGLKLQGVILRWRVVHLLTMGRLDEAEAGLRKLATAPVIEPDIELKAWLAWQRGQSAVALEDAGKALTLATERGRTLYRDFDLALLAAIHATSGDMDEACRQLGRYREATSRCAGRFAEFQALLIEAVIRLRCGTARPSRRCDVRCESAPSIASAAAGPGRRRGSPPCSRRLSSSASKRATVMS